MAIHGRVRERRLAQVSWSERPARAQFVRTLPGT